MVLQSLFKDQHDECVEHCKVMTVYAALFRSPHDINYTMKINDHLVHTWRLKDVISAHEHHRETIKLRCRSREVLWSCKSSLDGHIERHVVRKQPLCWPEWDCHWRGAF